MRVLGVGCSLGRVSSSCCRGLVLPLLAAAASTSSDDAQRAFLQGNTLYGSGELEGAKAAYTSCLSSDSSRTDCATNLASVLVDLGDEDFAEELYRSVLSTEDQGYHGDAAFNLALLLQDKKTEGATREAAALYKQSIDADESRWEAWANLASALQELRDPRAVEAFQQAILRVERAQLQGVDGYLAKMYYGYGVSLSSLSAEQCEALARTEGSLLIGVGADGKVEGEVDGGGVLASGAPGASDAERLCFENAQNALRTAIELEPEDPQARHMLAALSSAQGGDAAVELSRASPAFVQALFDDFSDTFDEKLGALGYKVPEMVGAAAAALLEGRNGRRWESVLDAGCGTGLAGPFLRESMADGAPLVGVDLSPKMLQIAQDLVHTDSSGSQSAVYDLVLEADLLALTPKQALPTSLRGAGGQSGFELLTAADVLVYFGELAPLLMRFGALQEGYEQGGHLIFSCERVAEEEAPLGWRMNPSGRYAHTKRYVTESAREAGYDLISYREMTPRWEGAEPVPGHLFVFSRDA